MTVGILWAIFAGIMLGLYALPEKFAKDFEFENTWGLMFFINMIIVPVAAGLLLVHGLFDIILAIPQQVLLKMAFASILWGIGVMMWGKAIDHIGLSLGFSLFIGTVILIGSLLPFLVDGLPEKNKLIVILIGISVVLAGVLFNGKAGLTREADEVSGQGSRSHKKSMNTGILIAVAGGLLATGFSYANAAGRPAIHDNSLAQGNPEWVTAVIVMLIIYISGAIFVIPYFMVELSKKSLWGKFKSQHLTKNVLLTSLMAIFNFAASATFAYAAYLLGQSGNTVGYAIFNTICVAVAILSGIITGEWSKGSARARRFLYLGLASMLLGVSIIAFGNGL